MGEATIKAKLAKKASAELARLSTREKDKVLEKMAQVLIDKWESIVEENIKDLDMAKKNGKSEAFIDRLMLNQDRVLAMAKGLRSLINLNDPVGETIGGWIRPNGMEISQIRVPLGLVGIIYESRPNVTADGIGLCIKTGNAVILRGGSDAINSNSIIADLMSQAAYEAGLAEGSIQLVKDTDRSSVLELTKLNGIVDVLIPRGGPGLIKAIVENSSVPVIETGAGNCHVYVDGQCDHKMALDIVVNAKVNRPGVCNAAETLLIDREIAPSLLPDLASALIEKGVELRGCPETLKYLKDIKPASEEDWDEEYLSLIMAVKVVDGIDQAIDHINRHGTGHSEAIVTSNYNNAKTFSDRVDAAAVYVNVSTRFTDGDEYGFGAEIGISTQKLHARGPMGLKELTTYKYIVRGTGQIR
ncbi:MAG: glutamate-5-semialdehyde dehydrogenase [Eubacteriales bacterium]|jgi:glutamate-5-semialdehyde dehydrogenase|nr:glutamate-5-semialdehyde dehydrogenase [Clostridia bacterium]MDI9511768.1 glutamate-5-semialdehyde dehydrogenase [Bacillota bacterium]